MKKILFHQCQSHQKQTIRFTHEIKNTLTVFTNTLSKLYKAFIAIQMKKKKSSKFNLYQAQVWRKCLSRGMNSSKNTFSRLLKQKLKLQCPEQDKTIYSAVRSVNSLSYTKTEVPEGRVLITFHNKHCCDPRECRTQF